MATRSHGDQTVKTDGHTWFIHSNNVNFLMNSWIKWNLWICIRRWFATFIVSNCFQLGTRHHLCHKQTQRRSECSLCVVWLSENVIAYFGLFLILFRDPVFHRDNVSLFNLPKCRRNAAFTRRPVAFTRRDTIRLSNVKLKRHLNPKPLALDQKAPRRDRCHQLTSWKWKV